MAEFFGTDYIANSMLYHAYKQRYMDVVVGPESSPQLKGRSTHLTCLSVSRRFTYNLSVWVLPGRVLGSSRRTISTSRS